MYARYLSCKPAIDEEGARRVLSFMILTLIALALGSMPMPAFAQMPDLSSLGGGGGLPWEGPICKIATSLSGPVAKAASTILIVGTGLMLAFGEVGGVFLTGMRVLFGLSLALGLTSWLPAMFPGMTASCSGAGMGLGF